MRTRHAFIVQLSVASNTQSGNLIKNNKKKVLQRGSGFGCEVCKLHTHTPVEEGVEKQLYWMSGEYLLSVP